MRKERNSGKKRRSCISGCIVFIIIAILVVIALLAMLLKDVRGGEGNG